MCYLMRQGDTTCKSFTLTCKSLPFTLTRVTDSNLNLLPFPSPTYSNKYLAHFRPSKRNWKSESEVLGSWVPRGWLKSQQWPSPQIEPWHSGSPICSSSKETFRACHNRHQTVDLGGFSKSKVTKHWRVSSRGSPKIPVYDGWTIIYSCYHGHVSYKRYHVSYIVPVWWCV